MIHFLLDGLTCNTCGYFAPCSLILKNKNNLGLLLIKFAVKRRNKGQVGQSEATGSIAEVDKVSEPCTAADGMEHPSNVKSPVLSVVEGNFEVSHFGRIAELI